MVLFFTYNMKELAMVENVMLDFLGLVYHKDGQKCVSGFGKPENYFRNNFPISRKVITDSTEVTLGAES